ncbi:hypothetical protein GCM10022226_69540 [Sphaerisporangium flaviroseum]|uniref:TauD/TfdA-like domain-containing protein n=1 Tax=Sphaerisporangium flaviroseum TaxID=509199 RepID=A0ABP7JA20_9ACTN
MGHEGFSITGSELGPPDRLGVVLLLEEHLQIGLLDVPQPHIAAHDERVWHQAPTVPRGKIMLWDPVDRQAWSMSTNPARHAGPLRSRLA